MANYLGSARVANGGSYSPSSGTDNVLVQLSYGYRDGVAVSTGHTHNGSAITKEQEANINIAGLGDPTVAAALSISPASSGALATTWDRAMTAESSFALNIDNVNQTTPVFDKNTASYTTNSNPTFTVPTIPAHSTVIYYKFHAASAAATFTAPVGFDSRENNSLLTSPAYRGFVCYTRDFLTEQTNFVLGADSNDSPTGGVHGYIVLQTESAPTDVTIGDVDGDNIVERSQTGVVLSGTNLEATAGDLIMSPTDNINDASAITITTTNWTDTAITFDMPTAINMLYGEKFFFVRTDSLEENASGKSVTLTPPAGNDFVTIHENSDFGLLAGTTGLEFGADQLEFQTTSQGGGTVYVSISGTVLIYDYAGAVPATEEIYIRLGDDSDQTWSSASLETITIGSTLTEVLSDLSLSSSVLNSTETSQLISYSILNDVIVSLATSYDVLALVDSDLSISADVLNSVVADKAVTYSLLNEVLSDKEISANILNAVDSDKSISFDLLQSVVADYSPSWNVASALSEVLSDLAVSYNALNSVNIDKAISWDALNSITADQALSFNILSEVLSSLQLSADVLNEVVSSQAISWDLLSALTAVLSDLAAQWDIRQEVVSSLVLQADVLNAVNTDTSLLFDIVTAVTSDLSQSWDITSLTSVNTDLVSSWSLLESTESSLVISYDVGDVTITTPESRTIFIPRETRTLVVDLETRTITVN